MDEVLQDEGHGDEHQHQEKPVLLGKEGAHLGGWVGKAARRRPDPIVPTTATVTVANIAPSCPRTAAYRSANRNVGMGLRMPVPFPCFAILTMPSKSSHPA